MTTSPRVTRADFAERVGLAADASEDEILAAVDRKLAAKAAGSIPPGGAYPVSDPDVMSDAEYDSLTAASAKLPALTGEDAETWRALFGGDS
ncbi:hypothetical protein AB0870_08090 [Microbacterium proteolyticum]|uniref:hypothetical protein n=1 Tax=Microbacterium proteolyticum TaxID=1572644 RepID=UPI002415BEC8|nr:hypothetical protein [Microbacterium proteolyticum]